MTLLEAVRDLVHNAVISTAEQDRAGEPANLVDALFAVARALEDHAKAIDRLAEKGEGV